MIESQSTRWCYSTHESTEYIKNQYHNIDLDDGDEKNSY